uniref:Uncharacterized protein n=1 Tax=Anguilla anguilla TaxID=7936 RepID=A0A0E9RSH2_ANGAN
MFSMNIIGHTTYFPLLLMHCSYTLFTLQQQTVYWY